MNKELLVPLISGVVIAFVTHLVIPLIKKRLNMKTLPSKAGSKGTPRRSKSLLHTAVGGLVGVLVGYFLILPLIFSSCPCFASTKVSITSPTANSSAPRLVPVQGTSCNIPDGKELWILVVPEGVTAYYPQIGPVVVTGNGNWSTSAYVGREGSVDIERGFALIATLADQQGGAAIRGYFSKSGSEIKGLEPLPNGIQIMDQVRVVRR